jgi:glycosidase
LPIGGFDPARECPMINDLWYKNAVIYCVSVGTYMDSNGDGIGDFKGLVRRLDYLHGLGVTAIWLMPFQVSPHRDDGYDVSDYYGVDPRYGTIGDFVEFTHGAKQRGIRVLIDLVVNHTSNEHSCSSRHARTLARSIATGTSGPRRRPDELEMWRGYGNAENTSNVSWRRAPRECYIQLG